MFPIVTVDAIPLGIQSQGKIGRPLMQGNWHPHAKTCLGLEHGHLGGLHLNPELNPRLTGTAMAVNPTSRPSGKASGRTCCLTVGAYWIFHGEPPHLHKSEIGLSEPANCKGNATALDWKPKSSRGKLPYTWRAKMCALQGLCLRWY